MTQKDYIILAKAVKELPENTTQREVAEVIAVACANDNSRFNYNKFYKACGIMR